MSPEQRKKLERILYYYGLPPQRSNLPVTRQEHLANLPLGSSAWPPDPNSNQSSTESPPRTAEEYFNQGVVQIPNDHG